MSITQANNWKAYRDYDLSFDSLSGSKSTHAAQQVRIKEEISNMESIAVSDLMQKYITRPDDSMIARRN